MGERQDSGQGQDAEVETDGPSTPPVDFSLFILSLNASALTQLGEDPGPDGAGGQDLALARHTIDMIEMLERKTQGNLTGAEERLLGQVLFDLRMRYADRLKRDDAATR